MRPLLHRYELKILFQCFVVSSLFFTNLAFGTSEDWQRSFNLESIGQFKKAAEAISPYLEKGDEKEFAQMRTGWLYYLAGDYSQSLKYYQNALKLNQNSLETRLGMMLPLMAQQRWREAAQQANTVISASKWNYYAHIRLMACEEGLGLWDDLIDHAKSAQKRYPADPTILVYLARSYAKKGNNAEARRVYQQVLNRVPGHIEASDFLR